MPTHSQLIAENEDLRRQLAEAQDALRAIRAGEVDALVVQTGGGERLFALETAYEPYRVFVEHMQQGAASLTADGLILYANAAFAEIFGVPSARVVGASIYDLVGEAQQLVVERLLAESTAGSGPDPHETEMVLTGEDGDERHTFVHLALMPDGTRCAVVTDVTERVRQRELLASEQWLRVTLSSIGDAVLSCDLAGHVTLINPVGETLTRWSRNEAVGQKIQRVFSTIDERTHEPAEDIVARVLREGQQTELANHAALVTRDGRVVSIEGSAAPIRDTNGAIAGAVLIFHDVSDRRQVRYALEQSEARLRESESEQRRQREFLECLIANAGVCIAVVKGRELCYTVANPAFQAVAAGAPMVGRTYREVFPEAAAAGAEARVQRVLETGEPWIVEAYQAPVPGRSDATWEGQVVRLPLVADEEPSALVVVWDITERVHLEGQLRSTASQLTEASRAKDDFLATLSHELRTPLNAILGWAQLLTSRPMDTATTARGLDAIVRNAQAQAQLVTDILDVSRIVTGNIRLEAKPVDLVAVLYSALDTVRLAADAKGVRLTTSLSLGSPIVAGDPGRLQQVAWNLLTNAVKFTPRGGQVDVVLEQGVSQFIITVRDTGSGIDPEFLPRVFEQFAQADTSSKRQHGGLGLGLAIVRHLVELHGGTVEAKSEGLGKGAVFVIRLPVRAVGSDSHEWSGRAVVPQMDAPKTASLKGLRVLLVDDEADARDLVGTVLRASGAEVVAAESAREGLQRLRQGHFDVLLADIGMPSEDGYEFIRQVRALPLEEGGQVPAVALTAYGRADDAAQALAAGFQLHLAKPASPADLTAAVAQLARRLPESV